MPEKVKKSKRNTLHLRKAADILESISDGFFILDREWRFIYVNQRAASNLGYKPEELMGHTLWEKFPKILSTELETYYIQAMEKGEFQEFTAPGVVNDRWYHIRIYPSAEGILVYSHDITDRKKVEEALRKNEERLQRSQEIAHLGSWELNLINNRLSWSEEVYRIFGLKPKEFGATYEAFLEAVHPEDRAAVDEAYSSSVREGRDSYEIEHRVVRKSSREIRYVHEKCTHIRDESGKISRSIGMVHDITERKQAEEALAKAKDELEIKVKERTQDLAMANEQLKQFGHRIAQVQEEERKRIAYELHDDTAQYLSILKLEIEALLLSGKIQSPEVLDKLEFLRKDAERAFNDVRRYSHELRPGVLEHLGLQAALEQIAEDINKLNQTPLEFYVEGEEPKMSEEMKLAYFRIAQEALNNARKHAKASKLIIDLRFNHSQIWMRVSDNGIGFNKKEAYIRGVSQGSLGLLSMRERANLINADLKIESDPGKGTRVTVEVKL